jgi:hypothetical protein
MAGVHIEESKGRLEVLSGAFQPLAAGHATGRAMVLTVVGRNIRQRSAPLVARVGKQPVLELITGPGGLSFSGLLARRPQDGDRLYIRYLGHGEIPTNVVYRTPQSGGATPVA